MPNNPTARQDMPEWKALARHRETLAGATIASLFQKDPGRAKKFSVSKGEMHVDYSKHAITEETMVLLVKLARACDLEHWRGQMFAGNIVNATENRAALHTALRGGKDAPFAKEIEQTLGLVKTHSDFIRGNKAIKAVVTIGIGGSDTGAHLVCDALKDYADGPEVKFLSNVDPGHFVETLEGLEPSHTLFIIASKSFATQETITNALSAKDWAKGDTSRFIAVTGNAKAAMEFGIARDNILPIPDWVGGRYSLWSAMGLPIAVSLGFGNFKKLLEGARSADEHFRTEPLEKNIPVILGLLGIWHRNFEGRAGHAVLPYDNRLKLLPQYIQQIEMESNGKSVSRKGHVLSYPTAPIVFGEVGTNGQHAFYQLLHQGELTASCDFILCAKPQKELGDHHRKLLANALAQSQALAFGQENLNEPHRNFTGNRPSTTFILDDISPFTLGLLLALSEHKTFVQGILWDVNSFDQWGVELGKQLTGPMIDALARKKTQGLDPSSQSLVEIINAIT